MNKFFSIKLSNKRRRYARSLISIIASILFILLVWQAIIFATHVPDYFLPSPTEVFSTIWLKKTLLVSAAVVTLGEAILGFLLALVFGILAALILFHYRVLHFLFWPTLLISQAVPTLAIAPLLVLWLGYGMTSKIFLVAFMLFFPITSAFLDGLRRTNPLWLQLSHLMTSNHMAILWHIRVPAAIPHLASGLKISAAGALLGAIVGEWVGASNGLGFLLLEANARFETNMVFAVILVIVMLSLAFYALINILVNRCKFMIK